MWHWCPADSRHHRTQMYFGWWHRHPWGGQQFPTNLHKVVHNMPSLLSGLRPTEPPQRPGFGGRQLKQGPLMLHIRGCMCELMMLLPLLWRGWWLGRDGVKQVLSCLSVCLGTRSFDGMLGWITHSAVDQLLGLLHSPARSVGHVRIPYKSQCP